VLIQAAAESGWAVADFAGAVADFAGAVAAVGSGPQECSTPAVLSGWA